MAKTAVVPDVFGLAPVLAPKEKGKKEKAGVPSGPALAYVAAIDYIMKSLKGVRETYEGMLKDEMLDRFVEQGMEHKKRPDNYRGVNGMGEASCEMRKRSTASPLTETEVEELAKLKIEVQLETVQEEMFVFNAEVLKNPELRAKISAAFAKIDFGELQPISKIEAQKKYVASEESIEEVFKKAKDSKICSKLVSMLTTLAVKSKWSGTKHDAFTLLSEESETVDRIEL
jgi:hypothetical protein